ncbi:MAG: hypothetical protein Fur0010_27160 [Bdellovibrio sp.]
MSVSVIAMGVAALLVIGLLVNLAVVSLLSGGFHFFFAKAKISVLKTQLGKNGFAFSVKWNSAREPGRFDKVRLRLFNPFGNPTQLDLAQDFDVADSDFARDVDFGPAMEKLSTATGLEQASIQIEVSSSRDGVSFRREMRALDFFNERKMATLDAAAFNKENGFVKTKKFYHTVERSFIAEPLPASNKVLKIATNPEFAGQFAGAAAAGPAVENFSITKVWIEPGCIVCNACEAIFPEVFKVTEDTCIINPGAPMNDGLKVQEAAEACPVEVIKFTKA